MSSNTSSLLQYKDPGGGRYLRSVRMRDKGTVVACKPKYELPHMQLLSYIYTLTELVFKNIKLFLINYMWEEICADDL